MLHGRIREAIRLITDQAGGGVLRPINADTKSGRSVLDVLREKHPPSGMASCDSFALYRASHAY